MGRVMVFDMEVVVGAGFEVVMVARVVVGAVQTRGRLLRR